MNQNFDDFLICPVCFKYFLDPVILPCENNVCVEHVYQNITENNSQKYECSFCNDTHEVPANGFIKNRLIIDIIKNNFHLKIFRLFLRMNF